MHVETQHLFLMWDLGIIGLAAGRGHIRAVSISVENAEGWRRGCSGWLELRYCGVICGGERKKPCKWVRWQAVFSIQ
jgi:hypothetical protein